MKLILETGALKSTKEVLTRDSFIMGPKQRQMVTTNQILLRFQN